VHRKRGHESVTGLVVCGKRMALIYKKDLKWTDEVEVLTVPAP